MDSIKEIVLFAVNLIVCCAVIAMIALLGKSTGSLADARYEDLRRAEMVRLNSNLGSFDNQQVLGIDVIAVIRENTASRKYTITLQYPGYGPVTVNAGEVSPADWSLDSLRTKIKSNDVFTAKLLYDGSGVIEGVSFTR